MRQFFARLLAWLGISRDQARREARGKCGQADFPDERVRLSGEW